MAETGSEGLQERLNESLAHAGPAVKRIFGAPGRRLSAGQFREFWRSVRMFAVATTGRDGSPHIAPVHVTLNDADVLEMAIFEDSLRLQDLRRDPRIAITTWSEDGRIAIVYGRVVEVPDSRRELARPGETNTGRWIIMMRIEMTRVFAMNPRGGAEAPAAS